jgi:oxygen-dependent protoporphyrinogen oxidase
VTGAEVVVVGSGIAGLACATELSAHGSGDVLVLEATGRAGGAAHTIERNGYTIERGPNTVRGNDALAGLARAAGLALVPARRAAPAALFDGEIVPVPPPLAKLVRPSFLPWTGWLAALAEPLRPVRPGPRTVREFVAQRFGRAIAERFADLATLGIYGTTADQVGFESAFPALADALEAAGGRVSALAARRLVARSEPAPTPIGVVSTAHGLGGLCERLGERLGERLRTGAPLARARGKRGGFELELAGGERIA